MQCHHHVFSLPPTPCYKHLCFQGLPSTHAFSQYSYSILDQTNSVEISVFVGILFCFLLLSGILRLWILDDFRIHCDHCDLNIYSPLLSLPPRELRFNRLTLNLLRSLGVGEGTMSSKLNWWRPKLPALSTNAASQFISKGELVSSSAPQSVCRSHRLQTQVYRDVLLACGGPWEIINLRLSLQSFL